MTFFRDLSPFREAVFPGTEGALNVGWLSPLRYCPTGSTPDAFRTKLFELCATPLIRARGFHTCLLGLCKLRWRPWGTPVVVNGREVNLGAGIVIVRAADKIYAAPDLIYHYVMQHRYFPPRAFIEAVLELPNADERSASPPSRLTRA